MVMFLLRGPKNTYENMKNLNEMTKEELKALSKSVENELDERRKQDFRSREMTKEDLLKVYSGYGYCVPEGAKFFRIRSGEYEGCYGWQVGQYTHSCHVDTTDLIVLLVYSNNHKFNIEEYADLWLEEAFTV